MRDRLLLPWLCLALTACHATVVAAQPKLPSAVSLTPHSEPGRPTLAVSPAQSLSAAALARIAAALEKKGHGLGASPSREQVAIALKVFQKANELAATGYPDAETLRKLGLTVKDL